MQNTHLQLITLPLPATVLPGGVIKHDAMEETGI